MLMLTVIYWGFGVIPALGWIGVLIALITDREDPRFEGDMIYRS